jgi:AcrR family transcriptional regulator
MENKDLEQRPLRSQPTRDRILEAARRIFARDGYDRATIRAIAAEADINPAMVMRYYGSKDGLFTAVTDYLPRWEGLESVPLAELGETLVRRVLDNWENPENGPTQRAILRASLSSDAARAKYAQQAQNQYIALLGVIGKSKQAQVARALIGTQIIGLLVGRYILRVPALAAMPRETLIREVGRTIQNYIRLGSE